MEPQRQLPEEDRPSTRPDIPGLRHGEHDPKKVGSDPTKSLGKNGLSDKESEGGGLYHPKENGKESAGKGLANAGLSAAAKVNPTAAALKKGLSLLGINNKKRGGAAGTVTVIIALFFTFGFGFLVSHEVQDIEAQLVKYAAHKILSNLVCRKLSTGSSSWLITKCNNGDETNDKDSADSEADASDPLESAMDKFNITDPDVVQALDKNGIKVNTDSGGNFTGLTDADSGEPITTEDILNNTDGIADTLDNALPEWDIGQIKSFVPETENHDDADFDGLDDESGDDVNKEVQEEVTSGVSEDVEASATTPAENAPPATVQADADGAAESGVLGKSDQAIEQAIDNGDDETQALNAGVKEFDNDSNISANGNIANYVSDTCSVQQAASEGAKTRVPLIMKLLVRHFSLMDSFADRLKTSNAGNVTTGEVSSFMKLLNGDPSLTSTITSGGGKVRNVASLPFSSSAAWARITGSPVDSNSKSLSYTPDIDKSSLPTANAGTELVSDIDSDVPGLNGICRVEESPIGTVTNGLLGAFSIVEDGFSLGTGELANIAAQTGITVTLNHVLIPEILKYFTPVALDGLENSVAWMNNSDAGGNIAFNDYSRSLGGQPETNATANQQYAVATTSINQQEEAEPLSDKVFAFNNPDSIVSKLALDMPTNLSSMFSDVSGFFENIPQELSHAVASITHPGLVFADVSTENPGETYGLTQYGFGDVTYSAVTVEHYLESDVTYDGSTDTRLDLLGNPSQYNNTTPDPSNDDILHCFLQGFSSSADQTTGNNDSICGSLGSYDYDNDTPQPITASNVADSYCQQLDPSDESNCQNYMISSGQVTSKDIDYFSQYIMDTDVMANYTSLESTSNGTTTQSPCSSTSSSSGFFTTQGNIICDKNGNQYTPYGISVVNDLDQNNWQTPQFGQASDAQIQAAAQYWHVNTIRIQVSETNFMDDPSPGLDYNQAAMNRLKTELDEIISDGDIPVISDNLERTDVSETAPTTRTEQFWTAVAGFLASQNSTKYQKVIFDIFNEPSNVTWPEWKSGGAGFVGMQDVVNTIRNLKNNPLSNNLLWVEGPVFATTLAQADQYSISGGNIVYAYHHVDFTQEQSQWEDEIGIDGIGKTAPIVDGEWAQYNTERPECYLNAPADTESYLNTLQQNNIGLVFWSLEPGVGTTNTSTPQTVTDIITPAFPTTAVDYSTPDSYSSDYGCNDNSITVNSSQTIYGQTTDPSVPFQIATGQNAQVLPGVGAGQEVLQYFEKYNNYGN
jgi:hypothetical protein